MTIIIMSTLASFLLHCLLGLVLVTCPGVLVTFPGGVGDISWGVLVTFPEVLVTLPGGVGDFSWGVGYFSWGVCD